MAYDRALARRVRAQIPERGTMADLEVHFEEFLHLAGLGHDKALIA